MTHISATIADLFARGTLPARVEDTRTGVSLRWSEEHRAYVVVGGLYVVWASTVRNAWGTRFAPAAPGTWHQGELRVA